MSQHGVHPALVSLGEDVLADVAHELFRGRRVVHLQLIASRFYEAVKEERARTSPADGQAVAILSAVLDQCARVAAHPSSPHLVMAELRAAVAMLTGPPCGLPNGVGGGRPVLHVIQGGRA
jgi:hypothetical protein